VFLPECLAAEIYSPLFGGYRQNMDEEVFRAYIAEFNAAIRVGRYSDS